MIEDAHIVILTGTKLYERLFTEKARRGLNELGTVTRHGGDRMPTPVEAVGLVPGCDVAVTGWKSPQFGEELLAAADGLRLIAHVGGSVREIVTPQVFRRGIRVVNAGHAMVNAVAEFTLLQILSFLRKQGQMPREMPAVGEWQPLREGLMGSELAGQRVGIVGVGQIGRRVISLVKVFGVRVAVYDPCLSQRTAEEMGAEMCPLLELLESCPIVSLHAPAVPATRRMIGAKELGLLPDGALLVNTARSWLTDEAALAAELRTGRITAAIDVFDEEPLPMDNPLRGLTHASLTPHVAFMTRECFASFGESIVADIGHFLRGESLEHEVAAEMLDTMA